MYLRERNISYRVLFEDDILGRELWRSAIEVLIVPGGESIIYLKELGAKGGEIIRKFVEAGGGYIGICAGAFYATSHREGGSATGPYGIGLLQGTAYDGTALQTPPFIEGMMDFDFFPKGLLQGLETVFRSVLFGGPSFRFSGLEASAKKLKVVARFQNFGEPAMVLFQTGRGHVFLSGPHLEIEEERTDWGPEFYDPDSEWPILDRVFPILRH